MTPLDFIFSVLVPSVLPEDVPAEQVENYLAYGNLNEARVTMDDALKCCQEQPAASRHLFPPAIMTTPLSLQPLPV